MGAAEAKAYGLIDEIVETSKCVDAPRPGSPGPRADSRIRPDTAVIARRGRVGTQRPIPPTACTAAGRAALRIVSDRKR
jgi:hypothetical protein